MFSQNPLSGPGSETLTTHTLEIIILLTVAFILGYLLSYFLRRNVTNRIEELSTKLSEARANQAKSNTELQKMVESHTTREDDFKKVIDEKDERIHLLEEELSSLRKQNDDLKNNSNNLTSEPQIDSLMAKPSNSPMSSETVTTPPVIQDDLKVIEGIGPVINSMLHKAGINTWSDLANTQPQRLREILQQGGDHLLAHDPTTWPEQATLAQEGKWDELKTLQDILIGGRRI